MSEKTKAIREFDLPDAAATARLGEALAVLLEVGDLILLRGDLGAGKTTLARALVQAHLASHGIAEEVPSPTFTLVQTYESPVLLIAHADLYRIEEPSELQELGLAEMLDEGVLLVEWPERAEEELHRFTPDRLDISLFLMPEGMHRARIEATGNWTARLEGLTI